MYWMISLVSLISMHSCSAFNSLSRSPSHSVCFNPNST
uniref:Uncharacterized protein n=1 Tax=Setaria viridis TaxID=4556 RepID=A0A4U6TNQ4_SETVI|nr:hypothetical protein SEVIR_7G107350v2 [Setaria viridis]